MDAVWPGTSPVTSKLKGSRERMHHMTASALMRSMVANADMTSSAPLSTYVTDEPAASQCLGEGCIHRDATLSNTSPTSPTLPTSSPSQLHPLKPAALPLNAIRFTTPHSPSTMSAESITSLRHNDCVGGDASKGCIPGAEKATSGHRYNAIFPTSKFIQSLGATWHCVNVHVTGDAAGNDNAPQRAQEHLPPSTVRDAPPASSAHPLGKHVIPGGKPSPFIHPIQPLTSESPHRPTPQRRDAHPSLRAAHPNRAHDRAPRRARPRPRLTHRR